MTLPLPRNRPTSWLIVLVPMLLQACDQIPSSACGTLFTYSPEFQQEAAKELDYINGTGIAPHVVTMMNDYHTTRETIRACK